MPSRASASSRGKVGSDNWGSFRLLHAGIERIAQSIAKEIECEHRDQDGQPRKESQPGGIAQVLAARAEHDTPVRVWRLSAKADEAQARGVDDGLADGEG